MVIYLMKYEPHPRPQRSTLDSSFSKSFASYSFRTLASHLKATASSNSFAINRFRTLCKIPGIGYPPFVNGHRSTICSTFSRLLTSFNSFTFNGLRTLVAQWSAATPVFSDASGLFPLQWGCIPPLHFVRFRRACAPQAQNRRTNCALFRKNFFACHTYVFHGGEGGGMNPRPANKCRRSHRRVTRVTDFRLPSEYKGGAEGHRPPTETSCRGCRKEKDGRACSSTPKALK